MDTQTILAVLDSGMLDAEKTVRTLCAAIDQHGALIAELRRNMGAAIETVTEVDKLLGPYIVLGQVSGSDFGRLVTLIAEAMGEASACGEALAGLAGAKEAAYRRAECDRLAAAQRGGIPSDGDTREAVSQS